MSRMIMVAGGILVAVVCAVVVRRQTPELALVLTICAMTAVLLAVSGELTQVVAYIQRLMETGGISQELIIPVLKVTGISMLAKFASEFCRDAKEGGLASAVDLAGTVLGLVAALPLMNGVLSLLQQLLD